MFRIVSTAVAIALVGVTVGAQAPADRDAVKLFNERVNAYVETHRRMEGPVPPLSAGKDMAEVKRLMLAVRVRIRSKTGALAEGHVFTPEVALMFRKRIAATLTRQDLIAIAEDVDEHTPPGSPAPKVLEPLPDDTPFVPLPPRLFGALPPLAPELRYIVVGRALVLWDHHADVVVDIAPGLLDPQGYAGTAYVP